MEAELRSFARSRGESICEAIVSRIFAEPTIIDLGLGLRAAVFRGLLGTACVVLIPFALTGSIVETGPVVETGRVTLTPPLLLCFASDALGFAVSVVDNGVVGLMPFFWRVKSGPSERFRDSCTLNMSSCIEERSLAGVPKLFDLLGAPGLRGVEGKAKDAVVAVLGRVRSIGDTTATGKPRS